MRAPTIIGITGGSGSGKSWLADSVRAALGEERVAVVEQDWYYRDLSQLTAEEAAKTDFDHPDSVELDLLENHIAQLATGAPIEAPQYGFSSFSRRASTLAVPPRPLIVVEGLFILLSPKLRDAFAVSVFVDTPSDIRLIRRIRRDIAERGYSLDRILDFWENRAHPMYRRFVEPQRQSASQVWKSLEDSAFVPSFLADLDSRLARNAH